MGPADNLYSQMVGWAKIVLPLCAIGLLSTLFLFAVGTLYGVLGTLNMADLARAIMTTDTKPKEAATEVAVAGVTCRVGGMAKGAAIGTSVGTFVNAAALVAWALAPRLRNKYGIHRIRRPDPRAITNMVRVGLPAAWEGFIDMAAFTFFSVFVGIVLYVWLSLRLAKRETHREQFQEFEEEEVRAAVAESVPCGTTRSARVTERIPRLPSHAGCIR